MIIVVNPFNRDVYRNLLDETFLIRNKVFNDRLDWNLPTLFGREIDEYDQEHSHYLICYNENQGVYGGCRLLPTTSPYMLKDTFKQVDAQFPICKGIWESSRFFIDTGNIKSIDKGYIKSATYELMLGMMELGISRNLTEIITLTDVCIERIFKMTGWPMKRLSKPVQIGNTLSVAASLIICEEYLKNIQGKSGIFKSVLVEC